MTGFLNIRDQFGVKLTTSTLHYNNEPLKFNHEGERKQVYICEDVARAYGVKIYKETCIGEGDYFITTTFSQRFQRVMPIIYNYVDTEGKYGAVGELIVLNDGVYWRGARQHVGNFEGDTEACQLMGFTRSEKGVFTSTNCFGLYLPWLIEELKKYPNKTAPYKIINQQASAIEPLSKNTAL